MPVSYTHLDVFKRQVVECLKRQTIRPDKIILYLSKEQFSSIEEIPDNLISRQDDIFHIEMVDGDLRSHKKFFYSFTSYPDNLVLLVDDDIYYPLNMVEPVSYTHLQFFLLKQKMHNVLSDYTWLIFWLMVTSYMQSYCQSFTRSLNKMMQYSIAGIVLTLSTALFSVLFIPHLGLSGYALSLILAQLVAAIYSFVAGGCYKYIQFQGNSWSSVKEMLTYSAPLLPNGIMWWLVNGLNRPIMEHFLCLAAIGLYAVANRFTGMLFSLLSILSTAWRCV